MFPFDSSLLSPWLKFCGRSLSANSQLTDTQKLAHSNSAAAARAAHLHLLTRSSIREQMNFHSVKLLLQTPKRAQRTQVTLFHPVAAVRGHTEALAKLVQVHLFPVCFFCLGGRAKPRAACSPFSPVTTPPKKRIRISHRTHTVGSWKKRKNNAANSVLMCFTAKQSKRQRVR